MDSTFNMWVMATWSVNGCLSRGILSSMQGYMMVMATWSMDGCLGFSTLSAGICEGNDNLMEYYVLKDLLEERNNPQILF